MVKVISILGSTGSIGTQTLEVVRELKRNGHEVKIKALAAGRNIERLAEQAREFQPELISAAAEGDAARLEAELKRGADPINVTIMWGDEGLKAVAEAPCDMLVTAIVGMKGLLPTLAAIEKGTNIALANKETMVAAGELVTRKAAEKGIKILPVDSEHSAIMQCLAGSSGKDVESLILTASGGPFRTYSKEEMQNVTMESVLAHPTWKMGGKITVDCATMMNKGLEVMEAHWLFDMPYEKIKILVHPQSIVHSMVQYVDGAVIAQMGVPDMKIPIQLALTYPERINSSYERPDLTKMPLTFEAPDKDKFRCLALAEQAALTGGTMPAALNGANEAAVNAFLRGSISFGRIPELVEKGISGHKTMYNADIDEILAADREARERIKNI